MSNNANNTKDETRKDETRQSGHNKPFTEQDRAYYKLLIGNRVLFPESSRDQCCTARYRGFER